MTRISKLFASKSVHTKRNKEVCLKFTQRMKFVALSVTPENYNGHVKKYRSGEYRATQVEDSDLEALNIFFGLATYIFSN